MDSLPPLSVLSNNNTHYDTIEKNDNNMSLVTEWIKLTTEDTLVYILLLVSIILVVALYTILTLTLYPLLCIEIANNIINIKENLPPFSFLLSVVLTVLAVLLPLTIALLELIAVLTLIIVSLHSTIVLRESSVVLTIAVVLLLLTVVLRESLVVLTTAVVLLPQNIVLLELLYTPLLTAVQLVSSIPSTSLIKIDLQNNK